MSSGYLSGNRSRVNLNTISDPVLGHVTSSDYQPTSQVPTLVKANSMALTRPPPLSWEIKGRND